ncbi:methyl-accepting chemotaxis protein [Paenibacillus sp. 481]|nr:methyl-accepting chemotaxis protein [Paenibacillus sp. 481]
MNLKLQNWKTSVKMYTLVATGVLFLVLISVNANYSLQQIGQKNSSLFEHHLKGIIWLKQMIINNRTIDTALFELMVSSDPARMNILKKEVDELQADNNLLLTQYKAVADDKQELMLLSKYEAALQPYRQEVDETIALASVNKNEEAYAKYKTEVRDVRKVVQDLSLELIQWNEKIGEQEVAKTNQLVQSSASGSVVMTGIALVLCLALGTYIVRLIVKPLQKMQQLMALAEQGDLTVRGTYNAKDEIGKLTRDFNKMMEGLSTIMRTVQERSQTLLASSTYVAKHAQESTQSTERIIASMDQVATGAQVQQQASQENATALEEFARGIQSIVENTSAVADLSNQSSDQANEGQLILHKSMEQMESIHQSVTTTSQSVSLLSDRSERIVGIVDVMSNIAKQTNLLALNASIEAARAGESGKGFAVVAGEVRKLAEQSATSAQQITALITEMQQSTKETVSAMSVVRQDVASGKEVIEQAGQVFADIVRIVQQVSAEVQEASAATEQMSAGTEELSASVDEMASIATATSDNVQTVVLASEEQFAAMENITSAIDELKQLADDMQEIVQKFNLA